MLIRGIAHRKARPQSIAKRFCRTFTSTICRSIKQIPILSDGSLHTFRESAFVPGRPYLLPKGHFSGIPAIHEWFEPHLNPVRDEILQYLNFAYLKQYGSTTVPLELTRPPSADSLQAEFERFEAPLTFFLTYMEMHREQATSSQAEATEALSMPNLYLAQAPLPSLPAALQADLPMPALVQKAGKGDVYDSSIWLGPSPTYTPLHRDPNPNLFVQLAGRKRVRMLEPDIGSEVLRTVKESIGASDAGGKLRGEEMMQGQERRLLEELIWGDDSVGHTHGLEAEVGPGDGLLIPTGWWHSIRGVGKGVVGSVNWWFR